MLLEPKYYWWGIMPYFRRFFMNLSAVVFRARYDIQAVRPKPPFQPPPPCALLLAHTHARTAHARRA